jgi:LacI family transcriptional regulator, galactose operon repressor
MPDAPRVPAKPRPPTRDDVARYAGVSTAVVSYVINDGPRRVAPKTAARVRAAIEILKYRPNLNARALKKGSTEMLGLVLPDITNPFFAEYTRALETAAAAHGYVLVVATSDGKEAQERRIVSDLANRHVDGFIIATVLPPSGFRAVALPGRPTVLINCSTPFAGYAALGPASQEGARALVDHLITLHGHQSVALIMGESSEPVPEPRERGWRDAFQAHDLPPGPIVRTSFSRRGGYEAAVRLLSWATRPSAIFTASDQLSSGALKAIREAELRCPDDIAVVSFDGTSESEYCWPPLTVARQPIQTMAEAAISAVLNLGPAAEYQRFDTEIVIRESCGCSGRHPGQGPQVVEFDRGSTPVSKTVAEAKAPQ